MDSETHPPRRIAPLLWSLVAIIILLATFQVGVFVGYRKATYSFRWGDNYHMIFAGPRRGLFAEFSGRGFMDAHGLFGTVLKTDGNTVIIKDKDGVEKALTTASSTVVRDADDDATIDRLTPNTPIVVIGSPNAQGQIQATFIRIMPPFPPLP